MTRSAGIVRAQLAALGAEITSAATRWGDRGGLPPDELTNLLHRGDSLSAELAAADDEVAA